MPVFGASKHEGPLGMRNKFMDDMKDAMRGGDKEKVATLRLIMAALKERDIAARSEGVEDGVGDDEVIAILAKMIKQREESAKVYDEGGRPEMAQAERKEIEIIRDYLPSQLDDDEVAQAINLAIKDAEANCLKDMGKVMALLKERHAGQLDFGKASAAIRARLQETA
tara:strand:+ start:3018 stop:3521 length:504 start_codon:yes stop_codon:yes gene_type:complete